MWQYFACSCRRNINKLWYKIGSNHGRSRNDFITYGVRQLNKPINLIQDILDLSMRPMQPSWKNY